MSLICLLFLTSCHAVCIPGTMLVTVLNRGLGFVAILPELSLISLRSSSVDCEGKEAGCSAGAAVNGFLSWSFALVEQMLVLIILLKCSYSSPVVLFLG